MKNEFAPYDVALAMKELGFDEECLGWFRDKLICYGEKDGYDEEYGLKAPTFSQAFRFFRDKYNQHCFVQYHSKPEYSIVVYNDLRVEHRSMDELTMFDTYEEAQDACLRKLIEIVKNEKNENE